VSADIHTLRVALEERSYDIEIGSGNLRNFSSFLRQRCQTEHAILITDTTVDPLYADALGDQLVETGWEVHLLVVDAGEQSKSTEVASQLWETMLAEGADRQTVVVAVGGGVVGDLAGFVAASYARGIPFVQIPTTLLAQVDSSVGGKVGVNLPGAKNMVGAFWQPLGVLIDVDVLGTLPAREYRAGLAEVVKYGVILDADFFRYLQQQVEAIGAQDPQVLATIVLHCCRLKAEVVQQDERETTGLRAILNYGHTFAHALEAAGEYGQLLHGEAVAMGMDCAARLAARMGRVGETFVEEQHRLLQALQLETALPDYSPDELLRLMYHDKKVEQGQLRFVLPDRLGHVERVCEVRPDDILAALRDSL
jgi:3-dehydroquinate synthase